MMWVCCAYRIASDRQERSGGQETAWCGDCREGRGPYLTQFVAFKALCHWERESNTGSIGGCACTCVCALCDRLQSFPYSTRHCVQCCWSALNGSTVRRSLRHDGQGHTTKTFGDGLKLIVSLLQAAHTLWRFYSALWWIAC